jgi:hypothetical protein
MIQPMKRTLAVAVVAGSLSGTLLAAPAASAAGPGPAPMPYATLSVVPGWTYQGGGRLAVIASCSQPGDRPVVGSKMLSRPVNLHKGRYLLIKVTHKTSPDKYNINLFCMGKHQQIDSAATESVRILKILHGFMQPAQPPLPEGFQPDVTVSTGPPPPPN